MRVCAGLFLLLIALFGRVPFIQAQDRPEEDHLSEEILYLELANIAAGHLQPTCKAPSTVSVISADRIRDIGARTIIDVLRLVPGLIVGMDVQGIPIVSLRGVYSPGSERVLFLLDGVPVNNALTGGGTFFFADLSVDKVERIEVIRGPGSVLYGSEAFAGVINIVLKKEFSDQLSYRRGSYDIDELGFAWDEGRENSSFWFNFSHRDQNSFSLPVRRDRFDVHPLFIRNAALPRYKRTSDWLRRDELYAGFTLGDLTFETIYINHADGLAYNLSGVPSDHSRYSRQKFWSTLFYKREFDSLMWESTLNFGYTYFDLYVDFYPPGTRLVDPKFQTKYFFPYGLKWRRKVHLYRSRFENKAHFSYKRHHFLAGLVFQYEDVDKPRYYENIVPYPCPTSHCFRNVPELRRIKDFKWVLPQDRFYYSLYFQDEFHFRHHWFLTFGVRYDNYDDFGDNVSFRLALVWSLLKNLYLKFLYGEGFRAPSFRELYIQSCPVMPRSGNPDLDSETMQAYEFGVFYNRRNLEFSLTLFYQRYEDLISLVQDEYFNYFYKNLPGDASTYGLESELKLFWGPVNNNYLSFSYAYLDHDDVRGFYVVPRNVFTVDFNQYLLPRLSFNYRLSYLDDWSYGVDSYFLSDVVFHYFHPLAEIHFAIYNVFDKKYRYPDLTRFYPDNYLRPGRIFELKFVYYF